MWRFLAKKNTTETDSEYVLDQNQPLGGITAQSTRKAAAHRRITVELNHVFSCRNNRWEGGIGNGGEG